MSASERRDEVQLLLEEAAYRLGGAVEHAPRDGDDARIACENAHDAIEVSLNAVIVARGEKYRASHDLSQLADVAGRAGEAIPAELNGIRKLRPYTGGGRYSYRGAGRIDLPPTTPAKQEDKPRGSCPRQDCEGRRPAVVAARATTRGCAECASVDSA